MVPLNHPRFVCGILALVCVACAPRYEYVSPTCPAYPAEPPGRSAIAWQATATSGAITGRVVEIADGTPIRSARAKVGATGRLHFSDSLGFVRFDSASAGVDTIFVVSLGHSPVSAAMSVLPGQGAVFLAAMQTQAPKLTDGCGFVLVQRKKPWWKVW
jgi:hypothetical protein